MAPPGGLVVRLVVGPGEFRPGEFRPSEFRRGGLRRRGVGCIANNGAPPPPSQAIEARVSRPGVAEVRRRNTISLIVIENPIINSLFDEPTRHFRFSDEGITD